MGDHSGYSLQVQQSVSIANKKGSELHSTPSMQKRDPLTLGPLSPRSLVECCLLVVVNLFEYLEPLEDFGPFLERELPEELVDAYEWTRNNRMRKCYHCGYYRPLEDFRMGDFSAYFYPLYQNLRLLNRNEPCTLDPPAIRLVYKIGLMINEHPQWTSHYYVLHIWVEELRKGNRLKMIYE